MKKSIKNISLTLVTVIISQTALALDFNSLIQENTQSQKALHEQIQQTVSDSKIAALKVRQKGDIQYVLDTESTTVAVKTKKEFLTFSKEKTYSKASQVQNEKRLAQEIKDLE